MLSTILPRLREVTRRGEEIVCWCPFHPDGQGRPPHQPNFYINPRKGSWYCHVCREGGSLGELARRLGLSDLNTKPPRHQENSTLFTGDNVEHANLPPLAHCNESEPALLGDGVALGRSLPPAPAEPEAVYSYYDETGHTLLYEIVRYPGKQFRGRRPDPARPGQYLWNLEGVPRALYNLPLILQSAGDSQGLDSHDTHGQDARATPPIYIVEGEKDADALLAAGPIAVSPPHGAGKWRAEYNHYFRGRDVIILPDNDEPGLAHAHEVARNLLYLASSVKVVKLPFLEEKGDVSNWLAGGFGVYELEQLVAQEPEFGDVPPFSLPGEFDFAELREQAQREGCSLQFLPFLDGGERPLFAADYATLMAGYPKAGKTSLLAPLACQWAAELGYRTLYITEEPLNIWGGRLTAMPVAARRKVRGVCGLGQLPLDLLRRAERGYEKVVIVDTTNLLGIQDGNDAATVWRALSPWIEMARRWRKTIIFAHHTNKHIAGDLRAVAGSYNFAAIVDCVMVLRPDDGDRRTLGGAARLFAIEPVMYDLTPEGMHVLGNPGQVELAKVEERVLEALGEAGKWMKQGEIAAQLPDPKPSKAQLRLALGEMAKAGKVERDPHLSQGYRQGLTYRWRVPATMQTALLT